MGRKKNTVKARTKNLKLEARPKTPPVEESDSESTDDGNFVPDTDSDSDSDSEVSNFEDDDLFGDVKSDTDFLIFSSALRVGHENALAREKEKHRKRKAHYTGNSDRSLRRHREFGRKMQQKGFQSVANIFKPARKTVAHQDTSLTPVSLRLFSHISIKLMESHRLTLMLTIRLTPRMMFPTARIQQK